MAVEKERTKDVIIDEVNLNFESLFLSTPILQALRENNFFKPSPIQLKAIPLGKCGLDLIVKSKSGTGKTAVFAIISLEMIDTTLDALQILILAPTREIAVQSCDVIHTIGTHLNGLKVEHFIGGLPVKEDTIKAKGCQIAVGSPGRILHLITSNTFDVSKLKLFILDEADSLMESNFQADINKIFNHLPRNKQMLAVSATFPNELDKFLAQYMHIPTHVSATMDTPLLLGLKHFVTITSFNTNVIFLSKFKNTELTRLLKSVSFTQCLIFCNYQTRAEEVTNFLNNNGWTAEYISGAQTQKQRLQVLKRLKEFQCRILLSTDLTARGIDAVNVDLVVNYDVPNDESTYLHRMGRAGRYGSKGLCISIASKGVEVEKFEGIIGAIGGSEMTVPILPGDKLPENIWEADVSEYQKLKGVKSKAMKANSVLESVNMILRNFSEKNSQESSQEEVKSQEYIQTTKSHKKNKSKKKNKETGDKIMNITENFSEAQMNLPNNEENDEALSLLQRLASKNTTDNIAEGINGLEKTSPYPSEDKQVESISKSTISLYEDFEDDFHTDRFSKENLLQQEDETGKSSKKNTPEQKSTHKWYENIELSDIAESDETLSLLQLLASGKTKSENKLKDESNILARNVSLYAVCSLLDGDSFDVDSTQTKTIETYMSTFKDSENVASGSYLRRNSVELLHGKKRFSEKEQTVLDTTTTTLSTSNSNISLMAVSDLLDDDTFDCNADSQTHIENFIENLKTDFPQCQSNELKEVHKTSEETEKVQVDIEEVFEHAFKYAIDKTKANWADLYDYQPDENVEEDKTEGKVNLLQDLLEYCENDENPEFDECDEDCEEDYAYNEEHVEKSQPSMEWVPVNNEKIEVVVPEISKDIATPDEPPSSGVNMSVGGSFEGIYETAVQQLDSRFNTLESHDELNEVWLQWQVEINAVRDYVQQNIYLNEMSAYRDGHRK